MIPTSGGALGGGADFGLLQPVSDKPAARIPIMTHDPDKQDKCVNEVILCLTNVKNDFLLTNLVLNVACMGTSMVLCWNECSFFLAILD
jgi:hypothetical protein